MNMHPYEIDHLAKLRPHLAECTVLLRSNGDFPLPGPCKLAAYGKGIRHTMKGGTGSGDVNVRHYSTIEAALKNAGFQLTTTAWLSAYDNVLKEAETAFVEEVKARAKEHHKLAMLEALGAVMPEPDYEFPLNGAGDVSIYVLSRLCGEGGDRKVVKGDYLLTDTEVRDILYLQNHYEKFLLVLNVGGPVDLSPLDSVENILVLSQLGTETAETLADILLGKANPSGRLTASWAAAEDFPAIGTFGDINETEYREGVYVGYRYYDTVGVRPRFPFGYGLSFTTFEHDTPEVRLDGSVVTISCGVKNTGSHAGKEVLQVYLSKPSVDLDQPFQELAAFAKTSELAPGAEETVTASFDLKDLSSFHEGRSAYVLEQGDYVVRVGASSVETKPIARLRLAETVELRTVRKLMGAPGFEDWKPDGTAAAVLPESLPVFDVLTEAFEKETVVYGKEVAVPQEVKNLPDEDLAHLTLGHFSGLGGLTTIVGNASMAVAGAAGDTTGLLKSIDLPSLVMADGPAGLRLAKQFFRDKKGVHAVGSNNIKDMMDTYLPGFVSKAVDLLGAKPKKNTVIEDQYTTAIPIGTALAQSFSLDLAELCGDIVGEEMERFGVHLWLAPALNIHRNVLCGRTFEYYSEDPLVSGLFAAAITKGVQSHKGCGVTVKHFCANNQEDNRYASNSRVSERAMREIYLRGFERCIRDARPKAVMSSYNLLNGVHTSESPELNKNILRDEFGFDGIIMTDWIIMADSAAKDGSVHPAPQGDTMAKAGTSLIMPGSNREYKPIMEALKNGSLTRKQLEKNASFVYNAIKDLA